MNKISKNRFDNIIKGNIIGTKIATRIIGPDDFGYVIDGKSYDMYYKKELFDEFKEEMRSTEKYSKFFGYYNNGAGHELGNQEGTILPKMASVGSSSRFCYLALRDGAGALGGGDEIVFEKECIIKGIKAPVHPQLDAYIEDTNTYVEVKCHEIFDFSNISLSKQYKTYLEKDFGITVEDDKNKTNNRNIVVPLSSFGIEEEKTRFDIKQLICHLLGIKSKKEAIKEATLAYLFFLPKVSNDKDRNWIIEVFEELQKEIHCIFNSEPIKKFTTANKIHLEAYAEYSAVMERLTADNIFNLTVGNIRDL